MTEEQSQALIIEPTAKNKEVIRGTEVGNRVSHFGNELESIRSKLTNDREFQDFVENAVRDTDSRRASVNAFEEFTAIANQVLEVGDSGLGK